MKNQNPLPEIPHFPVMLNEVINICSPVNGGLFIDCTFGGGGYSKKILSYSNTKVIALDRDNFILNFAKQLEKKYPKRLFFHQKKFSDVNVVAGKQFADAIIFDLGLSSIQLDNLERGFSFNSKSTLNMSMGLTKYSAEEVINNFSERTLKSIIKILGEEKDAAKIAKNIIKSRSLKKITKVNHLVSIIKESKRNNFFSKINPCTKTFQALRIFVNKEITELLNGIVNASKVLKPGGKILVVSFHSIEDKIVKYFFSNFSLNKSNPSRYFPENKKINNSIFENYRNKIFKASSEEIKKNPRSRSAKLRFAIRNSNKFFYPYGLHKKFNNYLELEESYV